VALWDEFVRAGVGRAARIDDGVAGLRPNTMSTAASKSALDALAFEAFGLATQSLLLGAEDVGRLALACERAMDLLRAGKLAPDYALPVLSSSAHTMRQAFETLASPDESGARTEGVPLEAARYELETLFPASGKPPRPPEAPDVPAGNLVRREAQPHAQPGVQRAPSAASAGAAAIAGDGSYTAEGSYTSRSEDARQVRRAGKGRGGHTNRRDCPPYGGPACARADRASRGVLHDQPRRARRTDGRLR
jgi:hypothetical protein